MSRSYSLYLDTSIVVEELKELLHEKANLSYDHDFLSSDFIQAHPMQVKPRTRESILEDHGFSPTVVVYFTLPKFAGEEAADHLVHAAVVLLGAISGSAILIYDEGSAVLQKSSNVLLLNSNMSEFWTTDRLALLGSKYQFRDIG